MVSGHSSTRDATDCAYLRQRSRQRAAASNGLCLAGRSVREPYPDHKGAGKCFRRRTRHRPSSLDRAWRWSLSTQAPCGSRPGMPQAEKGRLHTKRRPSGESESPNGRTSMARSKCASPSRRSLMHHTSATFVLEIHDLRLDFQKHAANVQDWICRKERSMLSCTWNDSTRSHLNCLKSCRSTASATAVLPKWSLTPGFACCSRRVKVRNHSKSIVTIVASEPGFPNATL